MSKLLTGISAYDPSEIGVTLAGIKLYGFAHDTKVVLKSVNNILAEFHLQTTSKLCQELMQHIGETVDYEVSYPADTGTLWLKGLSNLLENTGVGAGRLEYELRLGSEVPIIKFYIVGE